MMGRVVAFLLPIFALSFSFLVAISEGNVATSKVHQRCSVEERDALLGFKQSLSDPQLVLSTWEIGEDCCTWQGVSCSNTTNHVIKLDLREEGSLHATSLVLSLFLLHHLQYLSLSGISFNQASIPHSIGSLTELRYLDLSYSEFAGVIPPQLGNLTNLFLLDLSGNYLAAYNLAWMSRLYSLCFIDMSYVNLTSATNWLHEIKVLPSLSSLHLSSCSLHTLPASLPFSNFSLTINTFDLSFNNFNGILPNWIGQFKSLKTLNLQSNYLNGPISFSTLNPLCDLNDLNLAENNFIELIDDESVLKCKEYNMTFLDISYNQLSGSIPKWVGKMRNLRKLNLGINQLNGSIPHSLGQLINLHYLNGLCFRVPWVDVNGKEAAPIFKFLKSSKCGLFGDSIKWNFSKFLVNKDGHVVDRYPTTTSPLNIKLDGLIPESLGQLTNLAILDIPYNNLHDNCGISDIIPSWFWNISSQKGYLNMSQNSFRGELLMSLNIDIMSNVGLMSLNLSRNQFTGQIPNQIGFIQNLESLDLSKNHFSGDIPESIVMLKALSFLNLSYNHLSGRIPTGTQLNTFYESSYYGNPKLCGKPLHKTCEGDEHKIHDEGDNSQDDDDFGLFLGMGFGFAVGLWSILGILFLKRSWAATYFQFIDKVIDYIYVFVNVKVNKWFNQ
ncbi:probable LRR receptor-like serine/threonine-protein kinase IRK [Phalaenopsis equestris]|uniref:probable LRR receptor-like serine/threonine-protein kinase IRK n=1 Tax=Phalaenopsis equestris TaxID=78828 RepID=UPI0009E1B2B2|nr:probable LRR receptor-like serine/threonine-protein kinase IRK [Phalaenopsis equestris]